MDWRLPNIPWIWGKGTSSKKHRWELFFWLPEGYNFTSSVLCSDTTAESVLTFSWGGIEDEALELPSFCFFKGFLVMIVICRNNHVLYIRTHISLHAHTHMTWIYMYVYIYIYMYIYLIYIYNYSHMNMGVSRRKMLNPLRSFWTNTHSSNSRKTSGYSFPSPNLETGIPSYPWFAWQIETSQDEFEHGNPQKRKVNSNFLIRTLELVEFLSLCMISFGISLIFGSRTNHLQGFAQMFVVFLSWPLREKIYEKKYTHP